MGKVLFVSQNDLVRAENLKAVFDAYDGPKEFRRGQEAMYGAEAEGFSVVVCDALPRFIEAKERIISINIGHGITGDKLYGLDEGDKPWVDPVAFAQTDYAISASNAGVPIVAGQFGIPEERVLPLGMPRTDTYVGKRKGDGGTFLADYRRAYLYVPTFRYDDDGWLPSIDWGLVDSMLDDDEVVVVKRHYFTPDSLIGPDREHVVEVAPWSPTIPYLVDCDVVLSDYSSIVFDGYILGKPSLLTVDDSKLYLSKRGTYFPYPDFYTSRSLRAEGHEEELVGLLREAARYGMTDVERRCADTVADMCDGKASERVCALIRSVMA